MEKLLTSIFSFLLSFIKTLGVLKIKSCSFLLKIFGVLIKYIFLGLKITIKALMFCFFETMGRMLTKKYWISISEQPAIVWIISGITMFSAVGVWVCFNVGVGAYYGF